MTKSNIFNLRLYSWIDLILIGLIAKSSIEKSLEFSTKDIILAICLVSLWIFFNLILELKHSYEYRAKPKLVFTIIFLLIPLIIGLYFNYYTAIFSLTSTFFILLYLQKNKNQLFGNCSFVIRGLIQSQYYLYALMFYSHSINLTQILIILTIFLLSSARSIIGDIRDYKHNKESSKKTIVVNLGINKSVIIILSLFILSIITLLFISKSTLLIFPVILFALIIIFYRNGYILHQVSITLTSFVSINLILFFTNGNLFFSDIIFTGILLNMIFYPLLERKSNPRFE
ncbi:MAG: UbiA family prenyltransferase [Candidatus Pacearchaeota archaeon]|jgi:4-hydroxybenzoate polyprenyltransferase